jgi:aryl-phospho-beta-D-glucosidase BglC (GH1 family)
LSLTAPALAQEGVPEYRYARLSQGASITRWFWYPEGVVPDDNHYRHYVSDEELTTIRATGFRHIRLPIEPTDLFNPQDPTNLDARLLGFLDLAIDRMIAADLAVIVDIHNWDEDLGAKITSDPTTRVAYASMWRTLAAHLSRTDPDMVFLEVMNEPFGENPDWPAAQAQIAAAMREGAPQHTIIVGGANWNGIDGLLQLEPLPDPNIIYNFHFYEPHIFTHQGATWSDNMGYLRGIPYPVDDACDWLPQYGHDLDGWVDGYCNWEPWNAEVIDARIRLAYDWAQQHGVRLTANEFGVMPVAPYADRLTWFRDVVSTFERYGIGWTIWGYDDGFGLDLEIGAGIMDSGVLAAIGILTQ